MPGRKRSNGWRSSPAKRPSRKPGSWLPDATLDEDPQVQGRDQGAPHHARRRRHPEHQRGPAAEAEALRLHKAGPLPQGRAEPGQGAGKSEHGHLPREPGGRVRRHRVEGGEQGSAQGDKFFKRRDGSRTSRRMPASASSRSASPTPRTWSGGPSSTPSTTTARP